MTTAAQARDWLQNFEALLTPQAKRRLERDPDVSQLIVRVIESGWDLTTLAEYVEHGIGWQQPANARELMIWRLKKALGEDTE